LLIKQLADIKQKELIIPHFIPYLEKEVIKNNKNIMRYAEKEKKNNLNSDKNMQYSEIIRFDHIIRKALKVCEKES
jgi:hypothetical protein